MSKGPLGALYFALGLITGVLCGLSPIIALSALGVALLMIVAAVAYQIGVEGRKP